MRDRPECYLQGYRKTGLLVSNVLTFPMNGDNFVPLFEGLSDYWMPKDPDNGDWSAVNPNAKYPRIYGNRRQLRFESETERQISVRCFLSAASKT